MNHITPAIFLLTGLPLLSCQQNTSSAQSHADTASAATPRAALSPSAGDKVHKGDVVLRTQEEVTAFGKDHYTFIDGNLTIGPAATGDYYPEPVNLDPLASLQTVNGEVLITRLSQLTLGAGLQRLVTVNGSFTLSGCGLPHVRSFNQLTAIHGDLTFGNNTGQHGEEGLQEINGFEALISVESIYILGNTQLKTLKGFSKLEKTGTVQIRDVQLETLDNFTQLASVTGDFTIEHAPVIKTIVLPQLTTVGRLFALYENRLLNGNVRLPQIKKIRHLYIASNRNFADYCDFAAALREHRIDSINADGNKLNPDREEILRRCP